MAEGKVLSLYMTMPDLMRSGYRQKVEDFECDQNGISGDINYEKGDDDHVMVLVSKKSYDIIEEADLYVDLGVLLENIYVDIDLNHLGKGSIIEVGETLFEVTGPCTAFRYLYALDPEIPELLEGKRGLFIRPVEEGRVMIGDSVKVLKEVS